MQGYARAYEIKRALNTFQSVLTAAESGQRGYLLTGQTGYLEPYYRAMRGWRNEIERLRSLTSDNPERQQRHCRKVGEGDRRGDLCVSSRRSNAAHSRVRTAATDVASSDRAARHDGSRAGHRRAHDWWRRTRALKPCDARCCATCGWPSAWRCSRRSSRSRCSIGLNKLFAALRGASARAQSVRCARRTRGLNAARRAAHGGADRVVAAPHPCVRRREGLARARAA